MPNFRRGSAAITAAQESNKGGGNFAPFVPNIIWKDDREEKYILFLNPADEIPTVDLHEWIVVGQTKNNKPQYESFISRKDEALGEDYDDIEDRLGQKARSRTIGVAVELEPTFETVKGRQRPTGFQVKTDTYERRIKDSEDKEEVTTPVIGFIVQSPLNFYGWIGSFNESTAPIEETPLHVLRRGKDANTAYDFTPYIDQPVDFSGLLDNVEGINYLRDDVEELVDELEGLEPLQAALSIGGLMLEKRLEDLCDKERYDTLVAPIEELENKFGPKPAAKTTNGRTARPARQSPRVTNGNGGTATAVKEAEAEAPADDSPSAVRKSKFAKLRAEVEG